MPEYTEYAEKALDNIFDALDKIKVGEITILTGDNGTGKSLIRKVIGSAIAKQLDGERVPVADISMERRTGLHAELGGGGVFLRDTEWLATSQNSLSFLRGILNSVKGRYVVLDEPEIGMSVSLQASISEWLKNKLPDVLKDNEGVLIITHSAELVRRLREISSFVNLQGLTVDEWLNMPPTVIDLDEFEAKCSALHSLLQKHLKTTR